MQTCVGCGKNAPETDTNYTLISAQFGWRLARVKRGDGSVALEWRCPVCWRAHKKPRVTLTRESLAPGGYGGADADAPTGIVRRSEGPAPRFATLAPATPRPGAVSQPPGEDKAPLRRSRGPR